jgi:hypothetical protein
VRFLSRRKTRKNEKEKPNPHANDPHYIPNSHIEREKGKRETRTLCGEKKKEQRLQERRKERKRESTQMTRLGLAVSSTCLFLPANKGILSSGTTPASSFLAAAAASPEAAKLFQDSRRGLKALMDGDSPAAAFVVEVAEASILRALRASRIM